MVPGDKAVHRPQSVIEVMMRKASAGLLVWLAASAAALAQTPPEFAFAVAADMRQFAGPGSYDAPKYFRGVVESVAAAGGVAFFVIPGDLDPPDGVRWTIDRSLGPAFPAFMAVGNHETASPPAMAWLRAANSGGTTLPFIVRPGPAGSRETMYSLEYGDTHIAVLNEYFDGRTDAAGKGDIGDATYQWLADDLAATNRRHLFVVGHEPAWVQPDADNGRLRHLGESLDANPSRRDRFWSLLKARRVRAYLTGHTHCYSAVNIGGVWQIDVGHARGIGDTGARSTYVIVRVSPKRVSFETYRDHADGGPYVLADAGVVYQEPLRRPRLVLHAVTPRPAP